MSSKLLVYRGNKGSADLYFKLDNDIDDIINFYGSAGLYNPFYESTTRFYFSYSVADLYNLKNIKNSYANSKFYSGYVIANTEYKSDTPLTIEELISFIERLNESNNPIDLTYNFMSSKEAPIILNLLNIALYN